jgi:hypothetical protein
MGNRKAFLFLSLIMAVALVAPMAMAEDPDPMDPQFRSCTAGSFTISTDGPTSCDNGNTCISYAIGGSGTPDHVGTFLRFEAGEPISVSGSYSVTTPCGQGDNTLGLGNNLTCHERLIHWNNQQSKAPSGTFSYEVGGKRKPIITSVVVKKGGSQYSCKMVGVGFADEAGGGACVESCGNFNPKQAVLSQATVEWEGCQITKHFNTTNGAFLGVTVTGSACYVDKGGFMDGPAPVADLLLDGDRLQFADGEGTNGTDSCFYCWYGGGYSKVCR